MQSSLSHYTSTNSVQVYFKRISNREIAKQLESLGNNGITSHPIFDIRNTEEEKRFYGENILKEIFILHTIHRGVFMHQTFRRATKVEQHI